MRFVSFADVADKMRGRSVAVVGSGPSSLSNEPGLVDSHEVVVRVNNYKLGASQGSRTDIHYSFYGSSIRKSAEELKRDGVSMCLCKCPDSKPLRSAWHEQMRKMEGIDFRYIYARRKGFWFCDTFIPDDERFLRKFRMLGERIPTTGFCALIDVLDCDPAHVFVTGFDFFSSGIHNVDEKWRPGNPHDPIGHAPERELQWLASNAGSYPLVYDAVLESLVKEKRGEA